MAQNYGAGLYERLHRGLRVSLLVALGISFLLTLLMTVFGRPLLSLFIDFSDPTAAMALDVASRYFLVMSCTLSFLYTLHVFRHMLQGLGCGMAAVVSGVMEFVARTSVALVFVPLWGAGVLYFTEPFAWLLAMVSLVVMGLYILRRMPSGDGGKAPGGPSRK